jgi:hypothetical protein
MTYFIIKDTLIIFYLFYYLYKNFKYDKQSNKSLKSQKYTFDNGREEARSSDDLCTEDLVDASPKHKDR